jgi:hypothetical protein
MLVETRCWLLVLAACSAAAGLQRLQQHTSAYVSIQMLALMLALLRACLQR